MRRGNDNGILKDTSGKIVGINLGADYTSEHEWGIDDLKKAFGITGKGYGIERRTVNQVPSNMTFIDDKKQTVLLVVNIYGTAKPNLNHFDIGRTTYNEGKLLTAWDSKTFGINAETESDREAVREIHTAIKNNDLAIWLGGGGVFQNAGLVLAIVSRIPDEGKKTLYDADIDAEKLKNAALKTGIAAKLEKAGCRSFALSPKWAGEIKSTVNGKVKTKHEVIFWLNPYDQQNHEYGWYTVEDLELWAQGKGPVIDKSKNKRKERGL